MVGNNTGNRSPGTAVVAAKESDGPCTIYVETDANGVLSGDIRIKIEASVFGIRRDRDMAMAEDLV